MSFIKFAILECSFMLHFICHRTKTQTETSIPPHCQVMRHGFQGRTYGPLPVKPVDRPTNVSVLWTIKAG